jgi:hypothetical protein
MYNLNNTITKTHEKGSTIISGITSNFQRHIGFMENKRSSDLNKEKYSIDLSDFSFPINKLNDLFAENGYLSSSTFSNANENSPNQSPENSIILLEENFTNKNYLPGKDFDFNEVMF